MLRNLVLCARLLPSRFGGELKTNPTGGVEMWSLRSSEGRLWYVLRWEVASCGNSRLSAWRRTKDGFYPPVVVLTQETAHWLLFRAPLWWCAAEANYVGSIQTMNLPHTAPLFFCFCVCVLFCPTSFVLSFFFRLGVTACNRCQIELSAGFFGSFSIIGPTSVILIEVYFFSLHWNTAKVLPSCSMLLSFSSFSHNLFFFFCFSPSQRNHGSTLSMSSILTVSNS